MKDIVPSRVVSISKNVYQSQNQNQRSVKHFNLSVTKEDTSTRLSKRFLSLKSWQKKNTFVYLLKDCSKCYFRVLSTAVEPIFHREFKISLDVSASSTQSLGLPLSRLMNSIYLSSEACFTTQTYDCQNTNQQYKHAREPTGRLIDQLSFQSQQCGHQDLAENVSNAKHTKLRKPTCKNKLKKIKADGIIEKSSRMIRKSQSNNKQFNLDTAAKEIIGKEHFQNYKEIQNIISLHMNTWSDAERGDCLMKLLQHCGREELLFLADWIRKMREHHLSIDSLPKNILHQIFLNLNPGDLRSAEMVCHEWRLEVLKSGAWKAKCKQLVSLYGMENVYSNLEEKEKHFTIDWKQVFVKIKEAIGYFIGRKDANEESSEEGIPASKSLSVSNTNETFSPIVDNSKDNVNHEVTKEQSSLEGDQDCQTNDPSIDGTVEIITDELHKTQLQSKVNTPVNEMCDEQHLTSCQNIDNVEYSDEEPTALETRSIIQQTTNIAAPIPDSEVYDFESVDIGGLKSLKKVRLIESHGDAVSTLQCDSRRIFSGSADHQVRLWDIRSGKLIRILKGHKGGIRSLCFDKTIVASASWDTTVIVWDIVKFSQIVVLFGHRGAVTCVAMNESIIASGSADNIIRLWDRESWDCFGTLSGHKSEITQVVINEENLLSSSQDRTMKLWCLKRKAVMRTFYGHSVAILDAKVYGKLIASSSVDGNVLFWNFDTGHCEAEIHVHSSQVHCLSFHLSRFFTGSGDGVIREWDIETCTCLRSFKGHNSPILAISIVSSKIVSGSADGMIRIWDLENRVQQIGGKYNAMNENLIEGSTVYESGLIPKIDMKSC